MANAALANDGTAFEDVARRFLFLGIQEWGQSEEDRARVTAEYVADAGFAVEVSGFPIFGGIFPTRRPITGPDGEAATEWLRATLENLKRGEFNSEVRQLTDALVARASTSS